MNMENNRNNYQFQSFPTVIIEDFALFIKIGECLNILTEHQLNEYTRLLFSIYRENKNHNSVAIPASVPKELINIISTTFGLLLEKTGIDANETCILGDINNKRTEFKCQLKNNGTIVTIALNCNELNQLSSIEIFNSNLKLSFGFYDDEEFKKRNLSVKSRLIFSDDEFVFCRYYSWCNSQFVLYKQDYNFELIINPIKEDTAYKKAIILPCENQLESYLCALSFPCDMIQVIEDIISIVNEIRYQDIKIRIRRRKDRECFELIKHFNWECPGIKLAMSPDELRVSISPEINWQESKTILIERCSNVQVSEGLPPKK